MNVRFDLNDLRDDIVTNSTTGFTISPVSIPEPFIPAKAIDTLRALVFDSRSLGWVTDSLDLANADGDGSPGDSLVSRLEKRLDNVQQALSTNDSAGAVKQLKKFVNRVQPLYKEDQKGSVLTSEAYALLKFNAQFLIDKLTR